eukprot:CAMPEP_0183315294 /NCGR_PEP_ID=MMETSP0160_2-20130417/51253_1 /TAXON_ID=2839 ORGANISM="Odontella Sinensis, Strain Grunow 1884" /NCGR_SAMPLE_ID=MMETSP0160_2 /ASSEMBLY_ACC=CAM_ASM_000250 /LENGTH=245 /DNA_ID=CAMNT_0025480813 /DNA_START=47 /DNA_END=784 /DNA_ORIENTATION=-
MPTRAPKSRVRASAPQPQPRPFGISGQERSAGNEGDNNHFMFRRQQPKCLTGSAMISYAVASSQVAFALGNDAEKENKGPKLKETNSRLYTHSTSQTSQIVHPVICKRDIYVERCKKLHKIKGGKTDGKQRDKDVPPLPVSVSISNLCRQMAKNGDSHYRIGGKPSGIVQPGRLHRTSHGPKRPPIFISAKPQRGSSDVSAFSDLTNASWISPCKSSLMDNTTQADEFHLETTPPDLPIRLEHQN